MSIKFNPNDPVKPAMSVKDENEADAYLTEYLLYLIKKQGMSREEAVRIALNNIGYYSGYYPNEVQIRMEILFGAKHPLGSVTERDMLSPKEILQIGIDAGKKISNKSIY